MTNVSIAACLQWGKQQLASLPTATLDAEVLLCDVLQQTRAYLYTHPELIVPEQTYAHYVEFIQRRQQEEPVAYIVGHQEFWSLSFKVTPDVLIPRPETELLVETVLNLSPASSPCRVLELGTGSGAIICAIATERPSWQLTATDISEKALAMARQNAQTHQLSHIHWLQSDWFTQIPIAPFDIIVSNPPYLGNADPHLPSLRMEPRTALVSGTEGLDAIAHLIQTAPSYLAQEGWLALEHGCDQGPAVQQLMKQSGFDQINTLKDLAELERVTLGRYKL
jgi:release factor glutamine methyltransferase